MVTLFALAALNSSRLVDVPMLGPLALSTWFSASLFALMVAAVALAVIFGLWKKTPPTIAEVLRRVDSPRTPQR